MKEQQKARVVVELELDDYEALAVLKQICNLSWRDILIAGGVYWSDMLQIEEQIEKIKEKMKQIKAKNN